MKKITTLIVIFLLTALTYAPTPVFAADKMVFDSTDHYLGGCQLTDKSQWELTEDLNVTTFEVWYRWNQGETELPVKVYREGKLFAEFTAVRSSCDPYQTQWCNADFLVNKLFPKGEYSTQIPNARQCLKPGGTGAIRLYIADTPAEVKDIKPTVVESSEPAPIVAVAPTSTPSAPATKEVVVVPSQSATCGCTQKVVVTSVAASAVASLLFAFIFRRFK